MDYSFLGFSIFVSFLASFYTVKKYLRSKRWIRIGTLKQIFIYPLDGGCGQEIREAFCLKSGFSSTNMLDRSLIIYPEESKSAITHLETPELASQNIDRILHEFHYDTFKSRPYRNREINYLGDPIRVKHYCSRYFLQNILGHLSNDLRIAHVPPENRMEFINRVKSEQEINKNRIVDVFSSNYSSYTLINTTSLDALKLRTGIRNNGILPNSFRPHFIIEGYYPYCEDKVKSLKIGAVEFGSIIPCTHTDFINSRNFGHGQEPYATLQKTRALKKLRPELSNSNSPVFGINMELIPAKAGTISVGDEIYARF